MLYKEKYKGKTLWAYIDAISLALTFPWLCSLDYFLASFMPTTGETLFQRCVNNLVVGPCCLLFTLLLLPLAAVGFLFNLILWIFSDPVLYNYWEKSPSSHGQPHLKETWSIATANLCLLPEVLSKFNNNSLTFWRCRSIVQAIVRNKSSEHYLTNRNKINIFNTCKDEDKHVCTEFPALDFICFQEVWGRYPAWLLINGLKSHYRFFVYNVGKNCWKINHYFLGSGLMFASKYPILDVDFKPFTVKTFQGKFTSIGLLQIKVALSNTKEKRVGYIATTHLQSYQGNCQCLLPELDECKQWLENFRKKSRDEQVLFSIFCGDFNFDNMSPGDRLYANHSLFDEYIDPCRISAGLDFGWTIGTEFRQTTLWEKEINSPDKLKKVLLDPRTRRYFILDANILQQTMALAFMKPPFNENGVISSCPYGGRRRIDYILYNKKYPLDTIRVYFITALTQMTDHLPVAMTFTTK